MQSIIISIPKLRRAAFECFTNARTLPYDLSGYFFTRGYGDDAFYFSLYDQDPSKEGPMTQFELDKKAVVIYKMETLLPEMNCGDPEYWDAIWRSHWDAFINQARGYAHVHPKKGVERFIPVKWGSITDIPVLSEHSNSPEEDEDNGGFSVDVLIDIDGKGTHYQVGYYNFWSEDTGEWKLYASDVSIDLEMKWRYLTGL